MSTRQEDMWKEIMEAHTQKHNATMQYNQACDKKDKLELLMAAAQRRAFDKEMLYLEAKIRYEGILSIYTSEFSTEIADNIKFSETMSTFKGMLVNSLNDREKMPK